MMKANTAENTKTMVFTSSIHRIRRGNRKSFTSTKASKLPQLPVRKPARVAMMLAFAHKLQQAIDNGEYEDRADAARKLGLTRARVSQLLDLTMLAPDIQEKILFMERVDGVEPSSERALRDVISMVSWEEQRKQWNSLDRSLPH